MFFPTLQRRPEADYYSNRNDFYADYKKNYLKISEDCKHRCVYCDISIDEIGGDEMQLDHFRPQEHFAHLEKKPYNLYLSCPKCNVLKTSDWPCSKEDDAPSFIGRIGYIDRFKENADKYLVVEQDGKIVCLGGPIEYMIKKMRLNRISRVNIRRKRIIEKRKTDLLKGIKKLIDSCKQKLDSGEISKEEAFNKQIKILDLMTRYEKL